MIVYDRQTYNAPNPLARLAHRVRYKIANRLVVRFLEPDGSMLDFGCGDGRTLKRVREFYPEAHLVGYEPFMSGQGDGYVRLSTEAEVLKERYNLITAFEVLEHLEDEEITRFFDLANNTLPPYGGGFIIVSVPIMLGPVLIPKIINAQYVRRATWKYSFSEVIRAAVFLKSVPRFRGAGYLTHKGFDWRNVRARLESSFVPIDECFSPFPHLPWGLNSRWFGVYRRRGEVT